MDIPKQDIFVVSNNPGELVLKVSSIKTPNNPYVKFRYDKNIHICNDDIVALIQFFSGRDQQVTIHDIAITSNMRRLLDSAKKRVNCICAVDDGI